MNPLSQNSEHKVCVDKVSFGFTNEDTHGRRRIISRVRDHSEITGAEIVDV